MERSRGWRGWLNDVLLKELGWVQVRDKMLMNAKKKQAKEGVRRRLYTMIAMDGILQRNQDPHSWTQLRRDHKPTQYPPSIDMGFSGKQYFCSSAVSGAMRHDLGDEFVHLAWEADLGLSKPSTVASPMYEVYSYQLIEKRQDAAIVLKDGCTMGRFVDCTESHRLFEKRR